MEVKKGPTLDTVSKNGFVEANKGPILETVSKNGLVEVKKGPNATPTWSMENEGFVRVVDGLVHTGPPGEG